MLLAGAVLALGAAALRVASLVAPSGIERVLAAAAVAVATAVVETLALGLAGLAGESWLLAGAAVLTWLGSMRLPRPELPPGAELRRWWTALPFARRVVAGALVGLVVVWQAWLLRYATLGFDAVLYHLAEAIVWIGSGHAAEVAPVMQRLPVTNYPVTDEVLLTWGTSIARSYVAASLIVPAQIVLLALAAWAGLRRLLVPRALAGLGVAAVCSLPAVVGWQTGGNITDPASLAWLVTAAALCLASRERPLLLAPAIVAAGLAIGTKTTTAPLSVVVLGAALWAQRGALRSLWRPLALGAVAAVAAGGAWYLRNAIDHGSPLWPFFAAPWGTPRPNAIESVRASFADDPRETIRVVGDLYTSRFLGGIVLLAGALLAPLLAPRRRAVWLASAAAVVSALIWARAPLTGVPPPALRIPEGIFSTTRYLSPAIASAVLALVLAGVAGGVRAWVARLVLAAGTAVALVQSFRLGYPTMPTASTPLAGAAAGGAVALAAHFAAARWGAHRAAARGGSLAAAARAAPVAAALALGALLAVPAAGFVERHARTGVFATGVSGWLAKQPADDRPVVSAPVTAATLAGDRLERRLEPLPAATGCATLRRRARDSYVVLEIGGPRVAGVTRLVRCIAAPPAYDDGSFRAWKPAS
jgi:hypothetical protein